MEKVGSWYYKMTEKIEGHGVVIESYDRKTNSYLCRNSWGRRWGHNGKFRITRDAFPSLMVYDVN